MHIQLQQCQFDYHQFPHCFHNWKGQWNHADSQWCDSHCLYIWTHSWQTEFLPPDSFHRNMSLGKTLWLWRILAFCKRHWQHWCPKWLGCHLSLNRLDGLGKKHVRDHDEHWSLPRLSLLGGNSWYWWCIKLIGLYILLVKKMASIGRRYAPSNWYDDMMIIIDILESPAFQKYSTCWVF